MGDLGENVLVEDWAIWPTWSRATGALGATCISRSRSRTAQRDHHRAPRDLVQELTVGARHRGGGADGRGGACDACVVERVVRETRVSRLTLHTVRVSPRKK